MDQLNETLLDQLQPSMLEVTDIDIKRLRDDRSEIQLGDEVAFVATAAFRLTKDGVDRLKAVPGSERVLQDLAIGSRLFSIGADAELSTELLTLDEDSATRWLADHFDFTFLLDGRPPQDLFRPVGRIRVPPDDKPGSPFTRELVVPWIQKLNTAVIKGDYIDIDVQIAGKPTDETTGTSQAVGWSVAMQRIPGPATPAPSLLATLEVECPAHTAAHLVDKSFRIPVQTDGGELRFSLKFTALPPGPEVGLVDPGSPPSQRKQTKTP